jgi:hypothetical protein
MFDAATWRAQNRKHFALLENVYAQVGLGAISERWDSEDNAEYVARLVHEVGSHLLVSSVGAATSKDGKYSITAASAISSSPPDEEGARTRPTSAIACSQLLSSGPTKNSPAAEGGS